MSFLPENEQFSHTLLVETQDNLRKIARVIHYRLRNGRDWDWHDRVRLHELNSKIDDVRLLLEQVPATTD